MITDDEYLERIVAGIHAVTTRGADVTWNEVINGRQFDVVVRFKLGTLRYLVVIEVKNRSRKAGASDVEAFLTKARDQNANKIIFVTAAGFQEGAITVAKRHAVDLFTVTFDDSAPSIPKEASMLTLVKKGAPKNVPPSLSFGDPELVANMEHAKLVYADGKEFDMPDEQSQMNYYCVRTKLQDGRSLDDVIQAAAPRPVELNQSRADEIQIDPPQHIDPPDSYFFPAGVITSIKSTVTGRMGRPIRGNTRVDPGIFTLPVVYTNVVTGETSQFSLYQLPLGVKRVSVGRFYFICHPLMYYHCESIQGDIVRWQLIESFQSGELLRSTFTQHIRYSSYYIPVADKAILNRLQRRLEDYLQLSAKKI